MKEKLEEKEISSPLSPSHTKSSFDVKKASIAQTPMHHRSATTADTLMLRDDRQPNN